MTQKQCTTCKEWKDLDEFSKNSTGKYGRSSKCKKCSSIYTQQWHNDNPEKSRAQTRKWHQEHRDEVRVQQKQWHENNRNEVHQQHRQYYQEHRDEHRKWAQQWKQNNPEKYYAIAKKARHTRRARLKGIPGSYHPDEWYALCEYYDFYCLCCCQQFAFEDLTLDHIIPVYDVENCVNDITNFQPLCGPCNSSKGAQSIDYRLKWIEYDYPLIEWIIDDTP